MRTYEKQIKNIHNARVWSSFYKVCRAINDSNCGEVDRKTMLGIIGTTYGEDAIRRYDDADAAIKEHLQDIIEETLYGITDAQAEQLTKRYQLAMDRIGGKAVSMALPGPLRKIVQETTDLKAKSELMEAIADIKNV